MSETLPHPEWRLLVEFLKDAEHGYEIGHAAVAEVLGLKPLSQRYYGQVQRAKRVLEEDHQRVLKNVKDKGYRIILPNEHHAEARDSVRKAGRRVRRAGRVLVATPMAPLSEDERAHVTNALSKIGALAAQTRTFLKETRPAALAAPKTPKMLTEKK